MLFIDALEIRYWTSNTACTTGSNAYRMYWTSDTTALLVPATNRKPKTPPPILTDLTLLAGASYMAMYIMDCPLTCCTLRYNGLPPPTSTGLPAYTYTRLVPILKYNFALL